MLLFRIPIDYYVKSCSKTGHNQRHCRFTVVRLAYLAIYFICEKYNLAEQNNRFWFNFLKVNDLEGMVMKIGYSIFSCPIGYELLMTLDTDYTLFNVK